MSGSSFANSQTTMICRPVFVQPNVTGEPLEWLSSVGLSGLSKTLSTSSFVKSCSAMCWTLPSGSSSKSQITSAIAIAHLPVQKRTATVVIYYTEQREQVKIRVCVSIILVAEHLLVACAGVARMLPTALSHCGTRLAHDTTHAHPLPPIACPLPSSAELPPSCTPTPLPHCRSASPRPRILDTPSGEDCSQNSSPTLATPHATPTTSAPAKPIAVAPPALSHLPPPSTNGTTAPLAPLPVLRPADARRAPTLPGNRPHDKSPKSPPGRRG